MLYYSKAGSEVPSMDCGQHVRRETSREAALLHARLALMEIELDMDIIR